jgi:predicted DNA-binding transcriptional regulator AlpA
MKMARKQVRTTAAPPLFAPVAKDVNPLDERLYGYRLLTCRHVTELTGMTHRQRAKLEAGGEFPPPIRITQKIRLYPAVAVMAWIDARKAELR